MASGGRKLLGVPPPIPVTETGAPVLGAFDLHSHSAESDHCFAMTLLISWVIALGSSDLWGAFRVWNCSLIRCQASTSAADDQPNTIYGHTAAGALFKTSLRGETGSAAVRSRLIDQSYMMCHLSGSGPTVGFVQFHIRNSFSLLRLPAPFRMMDPGAVINGQRWDWNPSQTHFPFRYDN